MMTYRISKAGDDEENRLTSFKIRKLSIDDYDNIVIVWQLAGLPFKPDGRDSKENIRDQMDQFPELFLGAFQDHRLIGVVIGSYDYRMKGWINRLAVDPEYQKMGVASRLIKAIEMALQKRGATILCALIESYNKDSIRLFKEMQYVINEDVFYVTKRRSDRL
jgi:ribosomal protein S18 acetylase RimI-like enzyme